MREMKRIKISEIIEEKFGKKYGPEIIKALKRGIEEDDTVEELKKRLLNVIVKDIDQKQANAIFGLIMPAEWVTFSAPEP